MISAVIFFLSHWSIIKLPFCWSHWGRFSLCDHSRRRTSTCYWFPGLEWVRLAKACWRWQTSAYWTHPSRPSLSSRCYRSPHPPPSLSSTSIWKASPIIITKWLMIGKHITSSSVSLAQPQNTKLDFTIEQAKCFLKRKYKAHLNYLF